MQHARDKRFQTALDMQRALEAAIGTPTSCEQVANVQRAYLAARVQERKQKLTQALAEAAERAGLPPPRASIPSSHDAPPGEMRERFPTLPPEVIPSQPAESRPWPRRRRDLPGLRRRLLARRRGSGPRT